MARLIRSFTSDESGSVLIFVAIALAGLIALTVMVINVSFVYLILNRLQITADMAALAGASELPTETDVEVQANVFAELNMPSAQFLDVLHESDIRLGKWDDEARQFDPAGAPPNAVLVVTRRSSTNPANANPHPIFLGGGLGFPATMDLEAVAIAWATVSSCFANGYVAGSTAETSVESGSQNTFSGFCMHGQNGVKVGSDNVFVDGSQVSMQDLDDLEAGSDNYGLAEALVEADNEPTAANQIDAILSDFENLNGPFPDWLDVSNPGNVVYVTEDYSGPWVVGKLYFVDGVATVQQNLSNVGIYSTELITVDSYRVLQNVFMASEDKVEFGSNIQLGAISYGVEETPPDPNGCSQINGGVFMAAKNLVKLGSNLSMSGVQIISGGNYEVGSENKIHGAVAVQAAATIKFGSEEQYQGCNTNNEHILIPAGGETLRLVY